MKTVKKLLLLAIFIAISSWCAFQIYCQQRNTLYQNGHWIVSKTLLKMGVFGAYGFYGSPNALAGNHLDLSAWHGYQEVLYYDTVDINELKFDFLIETGGYLNFIYNKNDSGFCGFRISQNKDFPAAFFTCDADGKFLTKENLQAPLMKPGTWNRCRVVFGNTAQVYINGKPIQIRALPLSKGGYFGFRGGKTRALIDNIAIKPVQGRTIHEDFSYRSKTFPRFLFVVLSINALLGIFLFMKKRNFASEVIPGLLGINTFVAITLCVLLGAYVHFVVVRYPSWGYITMLNGRLFENEGSAYWKNGGSYFIRKHIYDTYSGTASGAPPARILFIGTSQTWGAGASEESKTFVKIIERKLNEPGAGAPVYQCINAGISGSDSGELFALYVKEWAVLRPSVVVIDLSCNDQKYNSSIFAPQLMRFAHFNLKRNIKTIFVLEAESIEETPKPLLLHKVMREVAKRFNIPTVDLHNYLLARHDTGFLWWDDIHLADYGQELAAEPLYAAIRGAIDER